MSVITTSELATYMSGETLDAGRSTQVVDAVNAWVESFTGRSFGATKTATNEVHDYASVIFLRHADVSAVSEVVRGRGVGNTTTLDADSYFVNPYGRLVLSESRSGFMPHRDYVKVTYTYGVASVPADLKLAALSVAADFYTFAADGNEQVTESQVGSYREKVTTGSESTTGKQNFAIINRYRTRHA